MKATLFSTFWTLILVSTFLVLVLASILWFLNGYVQAAPQFNLPEGAIARLGKGYRTAPAQYSPDGTLLAVPSSIGVWMYDAETFQALFLLTEYRSGVTSMSFSPDGQTFAGAEGSTVHLWDIRTGRLKATLHTASSRVGGVNQAVTVVFSPDGKTLASGSRDGTVQLWDVGTGTLKATFTRSSVTGYPKSDPIVAFSSDSRTLASVSQAETTIHLGDINSRRAYTTIYLWDINTGRHTATRLAGVARNESFAFSPDRRTLARGDAHGTVSLWDVATGTHRTTLTTNIPGVLGLSFSPNGQTLAIKWYGEIQLWDVATGTHRTTPTTNTPYVLLSSFSPDGQTLAIKNRDGIHLWDVATGVQKAKFERQEFLCFSPDGQTLVSLNEDRIHLWDVATAKLQKTFPFPWPIAQPPVSFSPDGQTLASTGGFTLDLWDVATATHKAAIPETPPGVTSLRFSSNGRTLTSTNDFLVNIWDIDSRTRIEEFRAPAPSFPGFSPVFTSDQQTAIIGSPGICLWNIATGKYKLISVSDRRWYWADSASFSPDGKTLASGMGFNLHLWDTSTGTHKTTLTGHKWVVSSVSFSPDGKTLASGDGHGLPGVLISPPREVSGPPTIRLWDVATGKHKATLTGHTSSINSLCFSPDGHTLASGHWQEILLWDVATATHKATLKAGVRGYQGRFQVNSLSFSPDGRILAIGSRGGAVLLWDMTPYLNRVEAP